MDKPNIDTLESVHEQGEKGVAENDTNHIAQSHLHNVKSPEERALLRKADLLILPLAALAYFVAYLDRNSIGNARIMGFQTDLKMTDEQFFNCITMMWVGYIAAMFPVNLTNRILKPHYSLAFGAIFWGTITCIQSRANSYATVMVLRTLLGMGQAFVQTINLYTSLWFKRDEIATRNGWYYSFATLSGSFGGLIAYGIGADMASETQFRPWGWLFLIEGIVAIGGGIIILILLPRYPDDLLKRSDEGKKHWYFSRENIVIAADRFSQFNTRGEKFKPAQLLAVFKDPKTYLFAVCQGAAVLGVSNVGAFLPTFINQFGYSTLHTQLFSIIPYAFAFAAVLTFGILSDKLNRKAPFLLAAYTMGATGYIILLTTNHPVAGIIASVLVTAACYVPIILVPVWMLINTGGYTKRAATWPVAETVGQVWAIMGTRIYDTPPRFIKGHSVVLAFNLLAIVCCLGAYFFMRAQNIKRDRLERELAERGEVHPHISERLTLEHVQDYHISFRYVL